MRKTDRDIAREAEAHRLNADLIGTGIHVSAGGRKGPYTVVVDRLNRRQVDRVITALRKALETTP